MLSYEIKHNEIKKINFEIRKKEQSKTELENNLRAKFYMAYVSLFVRRININQIIEKRGLING